MRQVRIIRIRVWVALVGWCKLLIGWPFADMAVSWGVWDGTWVLVTWGPWRTDQGR